MVRQALAGIARSEGAVSTGAATTADGAVVVPRPPTVIGTAGVVVGPVVGLLSEASAVGGIGAPSTAACVITTVGHSASTGTAGTFMASGLALVARTTSRMASQGVAIRSAIGRAVDGPIVAGVIRLGVATVVRTFVVGTSRVSTLGNDTAGAAAPPLAAAIGPTRTSTRSRKAMQAPAALGSARTARNVARTVGTPVVTLPLEGFLVACLIGALRAPAPLATPLAPPCTPATSDNGRPTEVGPITGTFSAPLVALAPPVPSFTDSSIAVAMSLVVPSTHVGKAIAGITKEGRSLVGT